MKPIRSRAWWWSQAQVTQTIRVSFTYWIKWKYSNVQGLLAGAGDVIPWSDAAILWGKGLNPLLFPFPRCDWRSGTYRSGMSRDGSWTFALPPQTHLFGHRMEGTSNTAQELRVLESKPTLGAAEHSKLRKLAFQVKMKAKEPQAVAARSWWTPLPLFWIPLCSWYLVLLDWRTQAVKKKKNMHFAGPDITSIHQSLTLGIKGWGTAKGNKVISWVSHQLTDHCYSNSNIILYIFPNLYILILHTLILMHTHQISRQERGPPTVGSNLIAWAKETLTATKSRVKFSSNAFAAENASSSAACTQHESILKKK